MVRECAGLPGAAQSKPRPQLDGSKPLLQKSNTQKLNGIYSNEAPLKLLLPNPGPEYSGCMVPQEKSAAPTLVVWR